MNAAAPRETWRRALHLASGSLGLAPSLLSHRAVTVLLLALLAVAAALELLRRRSAALRSLLERLAGGAIRPDEQSALTGASVLAAGYTVTWLLFPARAAGPAIVVAALADPAAALAGLKAGGTWGRKTWTGTAAACGAAFLVLAVFRAPWPACIAGALVAALVERVSGRGLDNLLVPVATAAAVAVWR